MEVPLTVLEVQANDGSRLAVTGELDLATADQFAQTLRRLSASRSNVLLDLSRVQFMDSSGLNALVNVVTDARRANRRIELRPELAPQVKRLLELTGLAPVLSAP